MADLHTAARDGDTGRILQLVAIGADLNTRDKHARTPLILAAWSGQTVRRALRSGARTPPAAAAAAALQFCCQAVQRRAQYRAKPASQHLAFRKQRHNTRPPPGPQECVKLLLAHGAQVGAAAMDDMNALHFAAQKGHTEAARALLNAGATVNSKTRKGAAVHLFCTSCAMLLLATLESPALSCCLCKCLPEHTIFPTAVLSTAV